MSDSDYSEISGIDNCYLSSFDEDDCEDGEAFYYKWQAYQRYIKDCIKECLRHEKTYPMYLDKIIQRTLKHIEKDNYEVRRWLYKQIFTAAVKTLKKDIFQNVYNIYYKEVDTFDFKKIAKIAAKQNNAIILEMVLDKFHFHVDFYDLVKILAKSWKEDHTNSVKCILHCLSTYHSKNFKIILDVLLFGASFKDYKRHEMIRNNLIYTLVISEQKIKKTSAHIKYIQTNSNELELIWAFLHVPQILQDFHKNPEEFSRVFNRMMYYKYICKHEILFLPKGIRQLILEYLIGNSSSRWFRSLCFNYYQNTYQKQRII